MKKRFAWFLTCVLMMLMILPVYAETDQDITFLGIPWDLPAGEFVSEVKSKMQYPDTAPDYDKEFLLKNSDWVDPYTLEYVAVEGCGYGISGLYKDTLFHNYPVSWVTGYAIFDVTDGQINTDPSKSHVVQMEITLDDEQITDMDKVYDEFAAYYTELYGAPVQNVVDSESGASHQVREMTWVSGNGNVRLYYLKFQGGDGYCIFNIVFSLNNVGSLLDTILELQPPKATNEELWANRTSSESLRHFEKVSIDLTKTDVEYLDGQAYIVCHFDWLNNTGEQTSFMDVFSVDATQNNHILNRVYMKHGLEDTNINTYTMPGETAEALVIYELEDTTSNVQITIEPWLNESEEYPALDLTVNLLPNLE